VTVRSLEELSDEDLLQAARDGRQGPHGARAASLLLERYQDRVYVWCFRMVREHESALDLAQETLLNAYRRLDSFEGRSAFASWLFVIARNRCLSVLRRPSLLVEEDDSAADPPDPGPAPDVQLEQRLEEAVWI
jgi:RNA polymerase sigma-70 factor (ECF subfamily)